ncbi:DUF6427 family protein [Tenacibaculum sp. UWU-22]|uniref:DUF6427 family protein n=1 Tax=Tenacibaculum sp. UWU-22 TaxID=3234187 RepID=UPI0034DB7A35
MLGNFFSKSKPITFVALLGLFMVFFTIALINKVSVSFLFENTWLNVFSYGVLLVLNFAFFLFIDKKNKLSPDNAYAFLFFILCITAIPESFLNEKTLLVNALLFLFFRKIYSLQNSKQSIQKLFDGVFWLSITFIIEPNTLVFIILLYASIFMYKKPTIQILIVPLVTFLIPVFLYFTYCFWYNETENFYNLFNWKVSLNYDYSHIEMLLFIGFFTLISLFYKTPKAIAISNRFKKNWILISTHFLVAVFFALFLSQGNKSEWLYAFFSIAIILANGLQLINKEWIKDFIIVLFLLNALLGNFL